VRARDVLQRGRDGCLIYKDKDEAANLRLPLWKLG
jgi:hypothetical protein